MINNEASKIRIALVGNPNCGKTTFFNALIAFFFLGGDEGGVLLTLLLFGVKNAKRSGCLLMSNRL